MSSSKLNVNESKFIRELKKQVQRLKQENAVLRKKNKVMSVTYSDYIELVKELENDEFDKKNKDLIQKEAEETGIDCPKCGKLTQPFEVSGAKFYKCHECGSKGRLKPL